MDALQLLRSAGWQPGRAIDVAGERDALQREGYETTPAAEALLMEYSGLTVRGSHHDDPLVIDATAAARDVFPGWANRYSAAIGSTLVPVGQQSHMTLYVDEAGWLWGGFDTQFGYCGNDMTEAVRLLLLEPGWQLDRNLRPPDDPLAKVDPT